MSKLTYVSVNNRYLYRYSSGLWIFDIAASFRSLSGARTLVYRLEKGVEHQSHVHRGISAFETGKVRTLYVLRQRSGIRHFFFLG